jgi:hypothetical protein
MPLNFLKKGGFLRSVLRVIEGRLQALLNELLKEMFNVCNKLKANVLIFTCFLCLEFIKLCSLVVVFCHFQ